MKKILRTNRLLVFIARFCLIVITGFLAFGLLIALILNRNIGPTYADSILELTNIQRHLPLIITVTAIVQAVSLCAIVMLSSLVWFHSITGPLARFRRYLKKIPEGMFPKDPLQFRDSDQLQSLAETFSDMAITYKGNCAKAINILADAKKIIDECDMLNKSNLSNKHNLEYALKINKLKTLYVKIKATCAHHKSD